MSADSMVARLPLGQKQAGLGEVLLQAGYQFGGLEISLQRRVIPYARPGHAEEFPLLVHNFGNVYLPKTVPALRAYAVD